MSLSTRLVFIGAMGLAAVTQTGCNLVPRYQLQSAQNRTRQLYDQNKTMAMDRQGLINQNQRLQQELASERALKETWQQRAQNFEAERNRLTGLRNTNPLSDSANQQFADLARKYPGFEFDPQTGVSKFQNDILFESGSDDLKPEATQLLAEFARILNEGDASQLNVLVVGHTDDRPVSRPKTRERHPDNWYLSSHRAISVVHALKKSGIKESRMGATGYGPHQPRIAQVSDDARRQNRRVEIFVLAPNASMAGWEPGTIRK